MQSNFIHERGQSATPADHTESGRTSPLPLNSSARSSSAPFPLSNVHRTPPPIHSRSAHSSTRSSSVENGLISNENNGEIKSTRLSATDRSASRRAVANGEADTGRNRRERSLTAEGSSIHNSTSHAPTGMTPRRPSLPSTSSASTISRAAFATQSSSIHPAEPSPTAGTNSASTKPTITIALQRAHSAVLLDAANDVPAAIEAYHESVQLLSEVMERVREGCARDQRLAKQFGELLASGWKTNGNGEELDSTCELSNEQGDNTRRFERAEKKWRAKAEEARRLKVIHDTYVDRIRMLSSFNSSSANSNASNHPTSCDTEIPPLSPPPPIPLPDPHQMSVPDTADNGLSITNIPSMPSSPMDPMFNQTTPTLVSVTRMRSSESADEATTMRRTHPNFLRNDRDSLDSSATSKTSTYHLPHYPIHSATRSPSDSARHDLASSNSSSIASSQSDLGQHSEQPMTSSSLTRSPLQLELNRAVLDGERVRGGLGSKSEMKEFGMILGDSRRAESEWDNSGKVRGRVSEDSEGNSITQEFRRSSGGSNQISSNTSSRFRSDSSVSATSTQRTTSSASMSSRNSLILPSASNNTSPPSFSASPHRPRPYRSLSSTHPLTSTPIANNYWTNTSAGDMNSRSTMPLSPSTDALNSTNSAPRSDLSRPAQLVIQSTSALVIDPRLTTSDADSIQDVVGTTSPEDLESRPSSEDGVESTWNDRRRLSLAITTSSISNNSSQPRSASYSSASLPLQLRTISQPASAHPSSTHFSDQPLSHLPPTLSRSNSRPHAAFDWNESDSTLARPTTPNSSSPRVKSAAHTFYAFTQPPPLPSTFIESSQTISPIRRPFRLMKLVSTSIDQGGYITPRLYIPQQVWNQAGVKLVAIETKVRMLDLLSGGLDTVEMHGAALLKLAHVVRADVDKRSSAEARSFCRELESLEGLMEGIQSTLEKKLGYVTSTLSSSGSQKNGSGSGISEKKNSNSFSTWSSKLSRSLERVTSSRGLDSPATYVESIHKLFKQSDVIDQHLTYLANFEGSYAFLNVQDRAIVELRLRRVSDVFASVICRFVMRDIGMLLDKYVKRGGIWMSGE